MKYIYIGIIFPLLLAWCQLWYFPEKNKGSSSEAIQIDTATSIPKGQVTADPHTKPAVSMPQWSYATQVQTLDK